ncbi:phytoene desaturase family protein [Leucobacter sp. W1038]|uniref:phytoene desaturase family protein n=1 Tax=Leucobacter sp. W1038 TaxID=3438281 RepID=UPI003D9561CB
MSSHVVVIGGGHNGLVAATYLARAGHRVTLVESRSSLGGVVGRYEYLPGYGTSIANSPGSFEGLVLEELELERHGLRFHRPDVTLLHPMRDGLFVGWRDPQLVAKQMDEMSPGESGRHRQLVQSLDRLGEATGLTFWEQPRSLDAVLEGMAPASRKEFSREIIEGTLMEFLEQRLKSDGMKSVMMMLALNGQLMSPHAQGSAFGLLMRPISRATGSVDPLGNQVSPLRGSVGLPIGSMAAIVDALIKAARSSGVEILLDSRVEEIEFDAYGHACGVVLESDARIENVDRVVSTIEPSTLRAVVTGAEIEDRLWPAPPTGSAFKIALALDGLPEVANAPGGAPLEALLSAQFRIGPDPEYITRAVEDGIAGRPSAEPIIWGLIPSLTSPGLAPEGKHLMSLNVWHAPHSLGEGYWQANGSAFVDRCVAQVEQVLPGLSARIIDRRWLSPIDLEEEFGLTGSNITHGDLTPESMLNGRPNAELVDKLLQAGIVLGGAGTWPGGYVTGAPGRRAALQIQHLEKESRA